MPARSTPKLPSIGLPDCAEAALAAGAASAGQAATAMLDAATPARKKCLIML
jgi:hypothetical protein